LQLHPGSSGSAQHEQEWCAAIGAQPENKTTAINPSAEPARIAAKEKFGTRIPPLTTSVHRERAGDVVSANSSTPALGNFSATGKV
jgi:hypothetical protein